MKVLFVCSGNTCRSPMAKTIFEQILKQRKMDAGILADSAGTLRTRGDPASRKARKVIQQLYHENLLANHKSKWIGSLDLSEFDLILTMTEEHKRDLPHDIRSKAHTLKEYAGLEGKIVDPMMLDENSEDDNFEVYIRCRDDIKYCLEIIVELGIKEWKLDK